MLTFSHGELQANEPSAGRPAGHPAPGPASSSPGYSARCSHKREYPVFARTAIRSGQLVFKLSDVGLRRCQGDAEAG